VGSDGASYVHVRGITFRYAANHAQRGAFAIGRLRDRGAAGVSRGWVVEDCVFERSNASGGSFSGEGHVFRRCIFQDNGQLGFGASYCHDTQMVECGIYRNNTKGYSTGWEAGGLKVCLSRGFVFDRCRAVDNRGCGIWYDIGNEKSEVKNCTIADNDEAGIFYEISYGLYAHDNLIVNNANRGETPGHSWGCGGITLSSSEDCIVENNTLIGNRDGIAFREQDRSTPRIDGTQRSVRVINRNHVIRNNTVAYSQAYNIALWMDTNFFGVHPSAGDRDKPVFEDPAALKIRFEENLLWPLAGRPNYLYGASWRPKSKRFQTPEEFSKSSEIPDTSRIADPGFVDVMAKDYTRK
jgi:parallel beta-helix repeat protein